MFTFPEYFYVASIENDNIRCKRDAAETFVQASCSIRRRLTQETRSLSVPVSWEPDYDWTQHGERRIVFFRGDTSQFASKAAGSGGAPFPTILTFHTDITEAEIATAMPAPQDLLRNRASWSLPSGSGASDFRYPPRPDRLTEITLVDNPHALLPNRRLQYWRLVRELSSAFSLNRLKGPRTKAPILGGPARVRMWPTIAGVNRILRRGISVDLSLLRMASQAQGVEGLLLAC